MKNRSVFVPSKCLRYWSVRIWVFPLCCTVSVVKDYSHSAKANSISGGFSGNECAVHTNGRQSIRFLSFTLKTRREIKENWENLSWHTFCKSSRMTRCHPGGITGVVYQLFVCPSLHYGSVWYIKLSSRLLHNKKESSEVQEKKIGWTNELRVSHCNKLRRLSPPDPPSFSIVQPFQCK